MLTIQDANGQQLIDKLQYTVTNPNAIVEDILDKNKQTYYNFLNGYEVLSVLISFNINGVGSIQTWNYQERCEAEIEINEAKEDDRLQFSHIPLLH
jgi:hypothetical protein